MCTLEKAGAKNKTKSLCCIMDQAFSQRLKEIKGFPGFFKNGSRNI